jgi:hypothetical protein
MGTYHRIREVLWALFISLLLSNTLHAQKKITDLNDVNFAINEYYLVTLEDNTFIFGVFRERIGDQIFFQTNYYSTLIADINDIEFVQKVSEENVLHGKYVPTNVHFNRYFFAQTAFNIPKHSVNLSTYTLLSAIEYGITDHVSIAAGASLISIFNQEFGNTHLISTKVGGFAISETVTMGATGFYGVFENKTHRMASFIWTLGNRNENLTFGLGYYNLTKNVNSRMPITNILVSERKTFTSGLITLSGMTRISKKTFLMTENWIRRSPELPSIYSLGLRLAGSKFMFDICVLYLDRSFDEFGPFLGFSYKF